VFEAALKSALKDIFDLKKVTFDAPGESQEQDCLFIEVETARNSIKQGLATARVTGKLRVYGNSEKLPYGYFSKCIQEAEAALTNPFFFYEFEENLNTYRNLVERSLSFVYFFTAQHDPNQGEIDSLAITEVQP
jgi:hypothetical protein